jgi:hypothetical protein
MPVSQKKKMMRTAWHEHELAKGLHRDGRLARVKPIHGVSFSLDKHESS